MIYSLNKSIQQALSRFLGKHISHMEIVYGITLLYLLLIAWIILGVEHFHLDDFLREDATFCSCML